LAAPWRAHGPLALRLFLVMTCPTIRLLRLEEKEIRRRLMSGRFLTGRINSSKARIEVPCAPLAHSRPNFAAQRRLAQVFKFGCFLAIPLVMMTYFRVPENIGHYINKDTTPFLPDTVSLTVCAASCSTSTSCTPPKLIALQSSLKPSENAPRS
jgi:hypothetical protein